MLYLEHLQKFKNAFLSCAVFLFLIFGLFEFSKLTYPEHGLLGLLDRTNFPSDVQILDHSFDCRSGAPRILLSWQPSDKAERYVISRNAPGEVGFTPIAQTSDELILDRTLPRVGQYTYQVKATNVYGENTSHFITQSIVPCTPETRPFAIPRIQGFPQGNALATSTPLHTPQDSSTTTAPFDAENETSLTIENTSTTPNQLYFGAYTGDTTLSSIAFEHTLGHTLDHLTTIIHFGSHGAFPMYLIPFARDEHKTLIIYWQSDEGGSTPLQPSFGTDAILSGSFDEYFTRFANDARIYSAPIILIPLPGANGDTHPYSGQANGNTPAKVVSAYRHIHSFFADVPNVQFGWSVDTYSVPHTEENAIQYYYPGDDVTDIVGLFGVNAGTPWQSFDALFSSSLDILEQYPKPIYLFGVASADPISRPAWIEDMFVAQIPKHPQIAGII